MPKRRGILLSAMGIRRRLLALSIGIAIPLTLVGLAMLWGLWQESRKELNHTTEEQSELAAVAFEKWIDGQRQSLSTLATIASEHPRGPFPFAGRLSYIVNTRPHWIDLRILDDTATSLVAQPPDSQASSCRGAQHTTQRDAASQFVGGSDGLDRTEKAIPSWPWRYRSRAAG